MNIQLKLGLVVGILLFASSPCIALQSGSRGSGSVASPAIQSTQSVVQGFSAGPSLEQFPNQFNSSGVTFQGGVSNSPSSPTATLTPQATTSSGRSSVGIPDSSLVDPIFEINDPASVYSVSHSAWDCLLSRYMVTDAVGVKRLRYGDVTPEDRNELKGYLQYLQSIDTRTLNRNEQLAFWFNLYNARTVDIVLDNYPIRSIRQVKMKFTDFVGPFDDPGVVTVLGKPLSLNDIESGIVRPVWKDPRIHYALNCASFGCPNLSPQAWTAANLDGRLNGAAYEYINSNRAIRRGLFGVRVSKIFKWYKDDFGGNDQAVLNHLRQYASPSTQQKLQGQQSICGYFYDWSLNDGKITRRRLLEPVIR